MAHGGNKFVILSSHQISSYNVANVFFFVVFFSTAGFYGERCSGYVFLLSFSQEFRGPWQLFPPQERITVTQCVLCDHVLVCGAQLYTQVIS